MKCGEATVHHMDDGAEGLAMYVCVTCGYLESYATASELAEIAAEYPRIAPGQTTGS